MTPRKPEIEIVDSPTKWTTGGEGLVTVSALGDLMLTGLWQETAGSGETQRQLQKLVDLYSRDELTFANLEATLEGSGDTIAKEPRLISDRETLRTYLDTLQIDILSLANNHSFDAEVSGFDAIRALLEKRGIRHLGAGHDLTEASRYLTLEANSLTFGWLAFADQATHPSHIASDSQPGVNPLFSDGAIADVERLKQRVDHVVVSLHWGIEYCHRPSPDQIRFARRLITSGASLIIGHHAHAIQGVEAYQRGVIAYNLGNAMCSEVYVDGRLAVRPTEQTRGSYLLRALFSRDRVERVELVPFAAQPSRLSVGDPTSRRILETSNRVLERGIGSESAWRMRRLYEDVFLRTLRKLDPKVAKSLRPGHFLTFLKNVSNSIRGRGPA